VGLEDKLKRMCNSADRSAWQDLHRYTKDIAREVAKVLSTGRWGDLPSKTQRFLSKVADDARGAADLGNAAELINNKVFKSQNSRVKDLKISTDLREVQEQIRNLFDTAKVPKRGFIYVAWKAKPELFMYVGKAGNVERLNLAAHGKLAHAAAHVTTISLIFPSQSRKDVLSGLEASVIRVIEHTTGQWPELNSRGERVPPGEPTMQLTRLAKFLRGVAKSVDALS
jgi:hypothetical protein